MTMTMTMKMTSKMTMLKKMTMKSDRCLDSFISKFDFFLFFSK